MSWRDRLQPGSFRGVPFHVDGASGQGGRRVAVHEYPQQEHHYAEDLGKKAGSRRLQAFVVGPDYDLARDELMAALDTAGPGTVVHPFLGTQRIQITDYDWTISTRKGGYCQFDINYVPAGKRNYPVDTLANAQALQTACTVAETAVADAFEAVFSVDSKPQFVSDAAESQLNTAIDAVRDLNGQFASVLQPIDTIANEIDQLGSEIATLILQPRSLASSLNGVIASVLGAASDIQTAFNGYTGLTGTFSSVDPVPTTTASRVAQATNQDAIKSLLVTQVSIQVAQAIATTTTPFTTYNQAMTIRDSLLEQLDTLAETTDDDSYLAIVELQTQLIRRVDEVAPGLASIEQITLQASVPDLVLAHTLYGDASRADELSSRNDVTHPLFVPAGVELEVLS